MAKPKRHHTSDAFKLLSRYVVRVGSTFQPSGLGLQCSRTLAWRAHPVVPRARGYSCARVRIDKACYLRDKTRSARKQTAHGGLNGVCRTNRERVCARSKPPDTANLQHGIGRVRNTADGRPSLIVTALSIVQEQDEMKQSGFWSGLTRHDRRDA
jgi:hypothetical protein